MLSIVKLTTNDVDSVKKKKIKQLKIYRLKKWIKHLCGSYFSACPFRLARNLARFLAATKVFLINMVTVIGPTPPGTGVMCPATLLTPEIVKNKQLN